MMSCAGRRVLYLARLAAQMPNLRLLRLGSGMRAVGVAVDAREEPAVLFIAFLLRTHHELFLGVEEALSGL